MTYMLDLCRARGDIIGRLPHELGITRDVNNAGRCNCRESKQSPLVVRGRRVIDFKIRIYSSVVFGLTRDTIARVFLVIVQPPIFQHYIYILCSCRILSYIYTISISKELKMFV